MVCAVKPAGERASAFASSLPPALFRIHENAGAFEQISYCQDPGSYTILTPSPSFAFTPLAGLLSFSFSVLSLTPEFVCRFSTLSSLKSSPPKPPLQLRPLIPETCVRLRTRRYYLLLRFTTDTRVLLRPVAYRRPFAPTFTTTAVAAAAAGNREIFSAKFRRGIYARCLPLRFPAKHLISQQISITSCHLLHKLLNLYSFIEIVYVKYFIYIYRCIKYKFVNGVFLYKYNEQKEILRNLSFKKFLIIYS